VSFITDQSGFVLWINEAYRGNYRLQFDKWSGSSLVRYYRENTDPATVEAMRKAAAQPVKITTLMCLIIQVGTPYWARIACDPLWDTMEQFKGYIAIKTDIQKRNVNADLISYNEYLLKW